MQARVWGCRGSLAVSGPETLRYGGNTSCVEVRLDGGSTLVLDAGTGIRALGVAIDRDPVDEIHILLTHLHLDHLQGLGFFRPLFRSGVEVHIWGPASPVQSLADRIAMYLSPPLFPVRLGGHPGAGHVPRRARGSRDDRLRDRSGREGHAPGTDRGLPNRGKRTDTGLPPGPRAVDRASISPMSPRSGSAATTSRTAPTCYSTTRNTATTSTASTSGGVTRASSTSWDSPQGRRRLGGAVPSRPVPHRRRS